MAFIFKTDYDMKLKTIYTFLLFFITIIISAQNTNGKVFYNVSLDPFYEIIKKKYEKEPNHLGLKMFGKATKIASTFECKLEFNKWKSLFLLINPMVVGEDEKLLMIAERMVVKGDYFTDLTNKKQILKDNSSKDTYVESRIVTDWTLTKENKKIGDYMCYKATTYKQLPSSKVLVTVWYTPQIPVAFGPKEFVGNLPGLILEYEDNAIHFIANKIVLNPKKPIEIIWPNVRTMTEEEVQKQSGSYQQLKESFGRD